MDYKTLCNRFFNERVLNLVRPNLARRIQFYCLQSGNISRLVTLTKSPIPPVEKAGNDFAVHTKAFSVMRFAIVPPDLFDRIAPEKKKK
jgi:hypothetical protein